MNKNNTTIEYIGKVAIPQGVILNADKIKYEHYKVNIPSKFQVHSLDDSLLIETLSSLIGIQTEKLDYVYFSVCQGAEPHTDLLDPSKFTNTTYVIPVILPLGDSIITTETKSEKVKVGGVYTFDHTKTHIMELDDPSSGCVLIIATALH